MSVRARRRPIRLLAVAAATAALGAALVLAAGGPAAAQAKSSVEIDGTAANKWDPATVTVKPGGTVTFKVAGGATHPVGSGTAPPGDKKFDTSGCVLPKMTKVGDSCTVKFPKAGTYPFFCEVHYALGMTGTITVGSGGGSSGGGQTTTTGGVPVVTSPSAAPPPAPSHPAIYWAGWGLFALGALLALAVIALYVRFVPGYSRRRR
jgi:plastocyanin